MKVSTKFQELIEAEINKKKESEPEFAEFAELVQKPTKNIKDCIQYILQTVKKSGCEGFADSEIFQMAFDYYMDDTIVIKNDNSHVEVTVNQSMPKPVYNHTSAQQSVPKPKYPQSSQTLFD